MNKKGLYFLFFIIFCAVLGVQIWITFLTTGRIYQNYLSNAMNKIKPQIDRIILYQTKKLEYKVSFLNIAEQTTHAQLFDVLTSLQKYFFEDVLYLADKDGKLFSADGIPTGEKLDTASLKHANKHTYSPINIVDIETGLKKIAFAVPFYSNASYYLVHMVTLEHFLSIIKDTLSIDIAHIALFDETAQPLDFMENTETVVSDTTKNSLNKGALSFSSNKKNILQQESYKKYSVFIPLEQPEGWFLGVRIHYTTGTFLTSGFVTGTIAMILLWSFIFGALIYLDTINDKEKKKELETVSATDQLTGLSNNSGLSKAVKDFFSQNSYAGYSFVYMDIVAFSRINAMFGTAVGNTLLLLIADILRNNYICCARTNADRFAFFAPSSDKLSSEIEQKMYTAIEETLGKKYVQLIVFKFGIYPLSEDGVSFRQIYDSAFFALKSAKKMPKQNHVVYDEEMKKTMELKKNIEINMLHALSKEEFQVMIQPQFYAHSQKCSGGEALIRWQSEVMGFLSPDSFIPFFESCGFIVETDFFMLESAFKFIQAQIDSGKKPVTIAVNQSKVTMLFPNYFERLQSVIKKYPIPSRFIELEITESTLENNMETIVPLISRVKKLGFIIAMDDFGSGFSSLNTLRLLPIDVLKIDKDFLEESDTSERSKSIIINIINMAKELDIKIICEGVETVEQLTFLKSAGCDIIQGYYFSKPIPIEEFRQKYF